MESEENQPVNETFLKDVVSINESEKDTNIFYISVIEQDILAESSDLQNPRKSANLFGGPTATWRPHGSWASE